MPAGSEVSDEDDFRRIVELAPVAMVMVDGRGRIALVNAEVERLFGYARDELLGQPIEILVPVASRASHCEFRSHYAQALQARPMGAGRYLHGQRKDGTEVPVEIGLNPIASTEGTMVLASIIDISERKRAGERFRLVVERAPNAMVMIDGPGRIVLVNDAAERLFGYTRAELLGQPIELLVPERLRAAHAGFRGGFLSEPHARPMGGGRKLYGLHKDGSEVPVEIGLNPIDTDDGPMVLAAIVDITERDLHEARLGAALREKETLLKEVYHRVKNNLQVISGLLYLHSRSLPGAEARAPLEESADRVRAMALVHEKLYQSGNLAQIEITEYVEALLEHLRYSHDAERRGIRVSSRSASLALDMEITVPFGLVLNELVANSLKHAFPDGRGGAVRVEVELLDNRDVRLVVTDDGVGFAPGFDPTASGSLGMKLVTSLATQLGGRVNLGPGPGARLSVVFPRAGG